MIICWYEKRIYLCNTIVSIRIVDFNLTYPLLNSNHLNPRKKIKEHKFIPKRVILIDFGDKQLHNPPNSFSIIAIKTVYAHISSHFPTYNAAKLVFFESKITVERRKTKPKSLL